MPHIFDGIYVWAFRRGGPPVDIIYLEEGLGSSGGMLRVVILHEPVNTKLL